MLYIRVRSHGPTGGLLALPGRVGTYLAYCVFLGRRELERRLSSAQSAMLLQEETIKRADRERCQLVERVDAMERSLAATDNDKRLLEVLKTSPHFI